MRMPMQASTVSCFENNPLVRKALEEPGAGRVLVVDAGGSKRCAVLGDNLAESAQRNGWSVSPRSPAARWGWSGLRA
jgi:regulator of RNase E activity RraA